MHYLSEHHILLFLVQLSVLLVLTRGLGELFRLWKQPALTAEILVGLVLGPTLLGRLLPEFQQALFPNDLIQQNMLETVAWFGVLFLLLDTGLEIDFSIAWRQRGPALTIALADIVIPMVIAFIPVLFLPDHYLADPDRRLTFALFMAIVMTISAMPVAARVLRDLNLLKTDLGFLTMSALAANDIVGWVLFTIVLGLFTQAAFTIGPVITVFAATIGFAAVALRFGPRLSMRTLDVLRRRGFPEPGTSFTTTCILGLLLGAVTQKIGIHALFGFFIAGVVMGAAKNLSEQTRDIISQMVHGLFVPLFFANIGLKLDFAANFDVGLVSLVFAIGVAGRYLGAWVGVTLTRVPRVNRNLIAIAHTPGGMMEVVVALLALEAGLITPEVFVAIVFSAVFSSVVMGPWMSAAMARRKKAMPTDFLERNAVLADLSAADRGGAIRALASAVADAIRTDSTEDLTDAVEAREREFGTALGNATAIPHARLESVVNPVLAYGRSHDGVEWDAPDGEPVRHVFLLLTPAGAEDVHVQILSRIGRVMRDAANRARLEAAGDATALQEVLTALFTEERDPKK